MLGSHSQAYGPGWALPFGLCGSILLRKSLSLSVSLLVDLRSGGLSSRCWYMPSSLVGGRCFTSQCGGSDLGVATCCVSKHMAPVSSLRCWYMSNLLRPPCGWSLAVWVSQWCTPDSGVAMLAAVLHFEARGHPGRSGHPNPNPHHRTAPGNGLG